MTLAVTGTPAVMARARSHGLIHLPESRCTGPLARYAQLRYHSHGHSVLGSGSAAGQPQARADRLGLRVQRPGTGRPACHWPAYPRGRPGRGRGSTVTVQASEVGLAAVTVTAWPQHFLPVLHSADHRNVTGSQLRLAGGPGGPVSVTRQPPCSRPGESLARALLAARRRSDSWHATRAVSQQCTLPET